MEKYERYAALDKADAITLQKIDAILAGKDNECSPSPADRRLLMMQQAAQELNVSRATILRMVKDGRLPKVEIREGTFRIPSQSITAFLTQNTMKVSSHM